ncbi:hypothetical protein IGI04_007387 [Brassica rapa subsp. trilocularis]|uniref:Uncharacterized protein n=1 Tax=Brassica rapa subsp. trilocularis TaxID=1813537 RepID=A0ABQ7NJK1_BRACM|nr:hypothetical protein IGI04_037377 [Brassica rapa subsp. trilocularis]KAG5411068.1 hypothetical protein IGI04_007387 [Brassica rapa subsp. trilocularis]
MGKLATTLDDFVPSSSSVPCCVEDQKIMLRTALFQVSGRVKLKDKTGSLSRTVFCLDIKESGRISQIIVTVLNLKCTGILLYTHSPESSRITVNFSCDTEQDHEDTMMGSHPGGRVTACSVSVRSWNI